jgi:hypothetical protein
MFYSDVSKDVRIRGCFEKAMVGEGGGASKRFAKHWSVLMAWIVTTLLLKLPHIFVTTRNASYGSHNITDKLQLSETAIAVKARQNVTK